jgi:hypothetical protein
MISFPGKHDDQVDSTTQALMWIREHGVEPTIMTFYRQGVEAERRFREARTVRLRSPDKAPRTVITIDGHYKQTDENGVITLAERDARPLRMDGWETLSEG